MILIVRFFDEQRVDVDTEAHDGAISFLESRNRPCVATVHLFKEFLVSPTVASTFHPLVSLLLLRNGHSFFDG